MFRFLRLLGGVMMISLGCLSGMAAAAPKPAIVLVAFGTRY